MLAVLAIRNKSVHHQNSTCRNRCNGIWTTLGAGLMVRFAVSPLVIREPQHHECMPRRIPHKRVDSLLFYRKYQKMEGHGHFRSYELVLRFQTRDAVQNSVHMVRTDCVDTDRVLQAQ
jgi:hypothetical protein